MSTEEVKVEAGTAAETAPEVDGGPGGSPGSAPDAAPGTARGTADGTSGGARNGTADDAPGGDAAARAEAAKSSRPKQRRMRDMALSLAVLLIPIGLFYVGWNWVASDRQVSVVDTTEHYATAASLGLTVIEPQLGEDWQTISTDLAVEGEFVTLRTGWYSPEGDGLQLAQTTGPIEDVNEELTGAGTPVESGGVSWASYELSSGEAWVAELAGATVVLTAEPDGVNELPDLAEGVAEAVDG
ncbi:DUF4245 family protein [Glycomyces harbinensis]|uniref:DUF4245 domain-containing protein n=1 Tax=Glycomyces harbinensis TaxID=58114 RepID=A0A1G7CAH7_9ACTN|nr:DUF4245 family protein [Glycomyces harbinensis]SDE36374.1 Protein of unknown function [Glycomyces harbinensis]